MVGLLLAAGAGRRMGGPKALVHDPDGTSWLDRAARGLHDGGCHRVVVVLGAAAAEARPLVPPLPGLEVVVAAGWSEGLGASLRSGLEALAGSPPEEVAALVSLVDLPDVGPPVVARLLDDPPAPASLARAAYAGVAGHPVLLGRDHWPGVVAAATGDRGARDYLAARPVRLVECGDLAGGVDVDHR